MSDRLRTFLFQYRITPQAIACKSPAELLMNRKLNNKLNIIKLDADKLFIHFDRKCRNFERDEEVCVRNFNIGGRGDGFLVISYL